jgi:hypothetical protein
MDGDAQCSILLSRLEVGGCWCWMVLRNCAVQDDYVEAFADGDVGEEGCVAAAGPVCVEVPACGKLFAAGAAAVVVGGIFYVLY